MAARSFASFWRKDFRVLKPEAILCISQVQLSFPLCLFSPKVKQRKRSSSKFFMGSKSRSASYQNHEASSAVSASVNSKVVLCPHITWILVKCRFWAGESGVGPEILHFSQSRRGMAALWSMHPSVSSKALKIYRIRGLARKHGVPGTDAANTLLE